MVRIKTKKRDWLKKKNWFEKNKIKTGSTKTKNKDWFEKKKDWSRVETRVSVGRYTGIRVRQGSGLDWDPG